jgi:hypothetical protein
MIMISFVTVDLTYTGICTNPETYQADVTLRQSLVAGGQAEHLSAGSRLDPSNCQKHQSHHSSAVKVQILKHSPSRESETALSWSSHPQRFLILPAPASSSLSQPPFKSNFLNSPSEATPSSPSQSSFPPSH